jgi:replicative DNA helicase
MNGPMTKQMPNDRQAEHACLSAIFRRGLSALDEVLEHVRQPEEFFTPVNAAIFAAMIECADAGLPIVEETLSSEMRRLNTYERFNAARVIESLRSGITTKTREHATLVRNAYRRREFHRSLHELADLSLLEEDMSLALSHARTELDRLDMQEASLCVPIAVAVKETRGELERRSLGKEQLIPSGFGVVDAMGLVEPGDLVIIGAESGTGKTAFGLGLARNNLLAWDGERYVPHKPPRMVPTLFISGEMGLTKLVMRWVSDMTQYDGRSLKAPTPAWLDGHDAEFGTARRRLDAAFDTLASVELSLTRPETVHDIDTVCAIGRAWAARMRRKYGPNTSLMIIVDYLQLLGAPSGAHRNARSDEIEGSKAVALKKKLADATGAAVVALSQLTLDEKESKTRKPNAGDLRGSKMLRNTADRVWLLWRPWICHPDVAAREGEYQRLRAAANRLAAGEPFQGYERFNELDRLRSYAELGIDKARGGAAFVWVPLEFTAELTRFLDPRNSEQRNLSDW